MVDLRERLEKTCKLAQDNVRKLDINQNAFDDKRARSRTFDIRDKVFLLLPSESNKLLFQWNGPYKVVEVVNMMNYKINVKGVVNTYPTDMLKQYVERQNVTSYRSAFVDARCSNVKSEDNRDPTVHRVTVDTVTSSDITCGNVMRGDNDTKYSYLSHFLDFENDKIRKKTSDFILMSIKTAWKTKFSVISVS